MNFCVRLCWHWFYHRHCWNQHRNGWWCSLACKPFLLVNLRYVWNSSSLDCHTLRPPCNTPYYSEMTCWTLKTTTCRIPRRNVQFLQVEKLLQKRQLNLQRETSGCNKIVFPVSGSRPSGGVFWLCAPWKSKVHRLVFLAVNNMMPEVQVSSHTIPMHKTGNSKQSVPPVREPRTGKNYGDFLWQIHRGKYFSGKPT